MTGEATQIACLLCGTGCPVPLSRYNVWTWPLGSFVVCHWCTEHMARRPLSDSDGELNTAIADHGERMLPSSLVDALPEPPPPPPNPRYLELEARRLARMN